VVRSVLVTSPEIAGYQVSQTQRGIHLDVVAAGPAGVGDPVPAEAVAQRLRDALTLVGFAEPEVCVRVVSHLDRQPDSGKLSRFVPLAAP
jgi:phenylacetate-CoA ligase